MTTPAYIPYGAYWSTPFARWQGSFAHLHSLRFAAEVAKLELTRRNIDTARFDYGILGTTIPQTHCFYGLPWLTGLLGADHVGGPTVNQACATSARCLQMAAQEIADDSAGCALVLTADRTSNGPTLVYPNPNNPGGAADSENWVLDNFSRDPYAGVAMVQTAENVAKRYQIDTGEQHDGVLQRHRQYSDAVERGFQQRFMTLPCEVPDARFRKTIAVLEGDEGIYPTSADKLATLKPVVEGGSVTLGGQTHPADGNSAMIVATREKARELSRDTGVEIRLLGFGLARTEKAHMPYAPIPAAQKALARAGLTIADIRAVKTHNPFIINDIVFARETGFAFGRMNNNGCSLIWGHPQGPTGLRAIIELIEELVENGGGYGLFSGCAAGDSAMAVIIAVDDAGG
jgi:acetyl-CoA acetyltransferase family protein